MAERGSPSFTLLDVRFSHWDFNDRDGWSQKYWLASGALEATELDQAFRQIREKVAKIIPRVALIGQCYVESVFQPYLILREDKDVAFFRFVRDTQGVGLMFMDKELKALRHLLSFVEVPEEFYYYWNDTVNSMGYSPKLLLMFSAIEALVKIREGPNRGKKDWDKLERILGRDLKVDLFGTIENSSSGLRHRLVHGEYFSRDDSGRNYLELVHKRIIGYFNQRIFGEELISEDVVSPQRHLFGNKEEWRGFLKAKETNSLNLKDVLVDVERNSLDNMKCYECVYDEAVTGHY